MSRPTAGSAVPSSNAFDGGMLWHRPLVHGCNTLSRSSARNGEDMSFLRSSLAALDPDDFISQREYAALVARRFSTSTTPAGSRRAAHRPSQALTPPLRQRRRNSSGDFQTLSPVYAHGALSQEITLRSALVSARPFRFLRYEHQHIEPSVPTAPSSLQTIGDPIILDQFLAALHYLNNAPSTSPSILLRQGTPRVFIEPLLRVRGIDHEVAINESLRRIIKHIDTMGRLDGDIDILDICHATMVYSRPLRTTGSLMPMPMPIKTITRAKADRDEVEVEAKAKRLHGKRRDDDPLQRSGDEVKYRSYHRNILDDRATVGNDLNGSQDNIDPLTGTSPSLAVLLSDSSGEPVRTISRARQLCCGSWVAAGIAEGEETRASRADFGQLPAVGRAKGPASMPVVNSDCERRA
ncbi:uncharacterized protein MYCGRDRAFT_97672 [Zymoseptoria tritici IPO323]|uniref:Uncharacterized protein n=1 Tax=Zymoseptoria tritici (strain CBS 115943 / IPO323) TaxID=336722 RepID=F9XQY4_ZYMTI|nr:uncharacterized protein MYCGRDRAFT_97672 [Zymoseptoria tritici IPO323]EGP82342.1 hypothetical protein MYCGRDRAFT_97672 [Zymoseptoria tritici IPO323]